MRLSFAVASLIAAATIGSQALAGECPSRVTQGGLDFSLPCYLHSPLAPEDNKVFFEAGSADLSAEAKATLDRQAAVLRRYPEMKIELTGYADTREAPSSTERADWGRKRAEAVRAYLAENGIDAGRISANGSPGQVLIPLRKDEETYAAMRFVFTGALDR